MKLADHEIDVARHYNEDTEAYYLKYWDDEDIHFGLFEEGETEADLKKTLKRMTFAVVDPADIQPNQIVVDAGCGIGGPARDLAQKYQCQVVGLTISHQQIKIAEWRTQEADLSDQVTFKYADCSTHLPFEDNSVDAVFSIQAACHFSNRQQFLNEVVRVLKPGGFLALSDWMAQDNISTEDYQAHIKPVCDSWFLAPLETRSSYRQQMEQAGLEVLSFIDFGDAGLENARIMKQSYLMFIFQEAAGQQFPDNFSTWKMQLKTISEAWLKGYFVIETSLAQKPS